MIYTSYNLYKNFLLYNNHSSNFFSNIVLFYSGFVGQEKIYNLWRSNKKIKRYCG